MYMNLIKKYNVLYVKNGFKILSLNFFLKYLSLSYVVGPFC